MKTLLVAAVLFLLCFEAQAQEAVPMPISPLGCSPTVVAAHALSETASDVYLAPEWVSVHHSGFDLAWRWCEDPKLLVGLNNVARPNHSFGMHVLYDGTTLGAPAAGGFYYLLLGLERSDGTPPQVSLSTSLKLALEGSAEHGCDTLGYDQLDIEVHASSVGGTITFEIDVAGTAYMLFPGVGALWTREVGSAFYLPHNIVTWLAGLIFEPSDLERAVHTGSSLGHLRFEAHTSMPGMHFQKHAGSFPIMEVDLDHVCDQLPLPSKPEFTYSMNIATGPGGLLDTYSAAAKEQTVAE